MRLNDIELTNAVLSHMELGVISYDPKGHITLINKKALEYLDINAQSSTLIDTDLRTHLNIPALEKHISKGLIFKHQKFSIKKLKLNKKHLSITGIKMQDGMLLCISNITKNVHAKDKKIQSLLKGQEMERRRLAKEIHDGIGPNMSALKLQIDSIKRKTDSIAIIKSLEEINLSISSIATDVRQISHDLMPSSLIDFGLVTALSNFAKKISESSDVVVHFQSNISDGELTKEYQLNLYRITQELVNNALKHGQCSNIEISLRMDTELLILLVLDDGVGMVTAQISSGIGLQNIKTRIESLHGNLNIDSKIGNGVSIHIGLPIIPINKTQNP